MTDAEAEFWRAEIRRIAGYWVRKWAWHQDRRALREDMEAVGWIVLLAHGPQHPRVYWEIQNAIQDEIARWLYGVKSPGGVSVRSNEKKYPRRVTLAIPLSPRLAVDEPLPDRVAIARVAVDRVWAVLSYGQRLVWYLLVMYGRKNGIARQVYRSLGWSSSMVHHRRMMLRRQAGKLL